MQQCHPRLAPQRLGQQAFQAVVLDAYQRRCAITGTKIRPVLQAAHVRPLTAGGQHRLDNGLLLRSDVHTLFDRGYLAVDTKHRLLVSPRLRSEFGNEQSYACAGQTIAVPERKAERPTATPSSGTSTRSSNPSDAACGERCLHAEARMIGYVFPEITKVAARADAGDRLGSALRQPLPVRWLRQTWSRAA
jgi:hypothetical protein